MLLTRVPLYGCTGLCACLFCFHACVWLVWVRWDIQNKYLLVPFSGITCRPAPAISKHFIFLDFMYHKILYQRNLPWQKNNIFCWNSIQPAMLCAHFSSLLFYYSVDEVLRMEKFSFLWREPEALIGSLPKQGNVRIKLYILCLLPEIVPFRFLCLSGPFDLIFNNSVPR